MNDDLVEAVAKAIAGCEQDYIRSGDEVPVARAAIAAVLEWQGKAGYVLAPAEPTPEMIVAGIAERHDSGVPEAWNKATANVYRAMLAAL